MDLKINVTIYSETKTAAAWKFRQTDDFPFQFLSDSSFQAKFSDSSSERRKRGSPDGIREGVSAPEHGGSMSNKKSIQITVPAALKLVDLIQDQVRQTESEMVKRILLRAGIKIADLAIDSEKPARRMSRAA